MKIDFSVLLQDLKDAGRTPVFRFDYRVTICWQNPRQIINETAACDMSQTFNHANWSFCQKRLIIFMYSQQFFPNRDCLAGQTRTNLEVQFTEQNLSSQRVAVCMQ